VVKSVGRRGSCCVECFCGKTFGFALDVTSADADAECKEPDDQVAARYGLAGSSLRGSLKMRRMPS